MFSISLLLAIVGAATGIAGGILSRANERKNAKAEIDQQLAELNLETAQGVTSLENQKSSDLAQAKSEAIGLGNEARAGQLAGQQNLLSLQAQGDQSAGNAAAQNAAGGIAGRTTVQDVLDENIQSMVNQERDKLDTATSTANMQIGDINRTFRPGSAYMNMYATKKNSMLQGAAQQESFLQARRKSYNYDWNWFLQDAFGVAASASQFAEKGNENNWWMKSNSSLEPTSGFHTAQGRGYL